MEARTRETIMACETFDDLLNADYGERGTVEREKFEVEAETYENKNRFRICRESEECRAVQNQLPAPLIHQNLSLRNSRREESWRNHSEFLLNLSFLAEIFDGSELFLYFCSENVRTG